MRIEPEEFKGAPISDECDVEGTKYNEQGNLLECGLPTIGAALVPWPNDDKYIHYYSICDKHKIILDKDMITC